MPYALAAGAGFLLGSIKEECGCHEPASRTLVPVAQTNPRSDDGTLGFLDTGASRCKRYKRSKWLDGTDLFMTDGSSAPSGFYEIYCCSDGTAFARHGDFDFTIKNTELVCPSEGGGGGGALSFVGGDGGGFDWTSVASFFAPVDQQASATPNVANYGFVPAPTSPIAPAAKVDSTFLLLAGGGVLLAFLMSR